MGKSSPPAAPNPSDVIREQNASNLSSATANAELNRINQSTPYGTSTYNISGYNPDGTPQYTQSTELSPASQNLLGLQQQGATQLANTGLGLLGQVNQQYNTGFNPIQPGQAQQQAQNAAYAANTQYLDPQFAQGQEQITQQLANQGLTPGTEAYNNAQGNFDRAKQAAYSDARNQAILQGNQAENQYYNQGLTNYMLPLNTYNALMSGTQYQNPNFQNVPNSTMATTNAAGINQNSYQDALQQYNAQQQANNNMISGVGNLGLLSLALLA